MNFDPQEFKATWSHIMTFFGSEEALREDVVGGAADMWGAEEEVLKDWSDACAYEGFNVKEFMILLVQKRNNWLASRQRKEDTVVKYSAGGKEKTFKYNSHESLMKDLCFLILVFLQRGSSWDKIVNKTNDGVVKIMKLMKEKYDIDTSKRAASSSVGKDVVTLPRIAACFPIRILQFLEMGVGRVLVDVSVLGDYNIPTWMQHPAMASVVPIQAAASSIRALRIFAFGVCVLTDDVLHRNDGKYTKLETIKTYMDASYNTPAVPDGARKSFLEAVGFYVRTGTKSTPKLSASELIPNLKVDDLINRILALRPNDPAVESIREWLKAIPGANKPAVPVGPAPPPVPQE